MWTPLMGNTPDPTWPYWAIDNGCYTKPEKHNDDDYLATLRRLVDLSPMFATAPDVVGDATATLVRSVPMLAKIRATGVPAALVAQDGLTADMVPWDAIDWLFLGGTTEWKLSSAARSLLIEATHRHVPVHMGRVNSWRRYKVAREWGCTSADGTYVGFGPDLNAPKVERWLSAPFQISLFGDDR